MSKEIKKVREAVALEYDPSRSAPTIIAAGRGAAAENIMKKAAELGIPLHEDPALAHTLNLLNIGDEIPPELYGVVAHILAFVAEVDKKSTASPQGDVTPR